MASALASAGEELLRGPLVTRLAQGGPVAPRFRPFRQWQTTAFQNRRGPLRIGLAAVPTTEPIKCDEFEDKVRVMYCINTQQLNPRFLRIMDEMAKTIGLT